MDSKNLLKLILYFFIFIIFLIFLNADYRISLDFETYIMFFNTLGRISLTDLSLNFFDNFPYIVDSSASVGGTNWEFGFAILAYSLMQFFGPNLTYALIAATSLFIKVIAFNLRNEAELDDISIEIKNECDEWHDLSRINDFEAANLIISKKINVLVDLCGHFARNRFRILKYKPAPVQALWMGYVNSSGIKEMDYLIADDNVVKKNEENQYIEKVLKLPNI